MRWSRRRHTRQRKQLRRAVAFLHETHDRVPFDPGAYIEVLPIAQIAQLLRSGRVAIRRLPLKIRHALRVWGDRHGVAIP